MASLPYLLLLTCLLVSFTPLSLSSDDLARAPRRPPPPPPPSGDYYILAVQWPTSYCYDKSNPKACDRSSGALTLPAYFTIHGLWPQKNNGQVLEYCTTEPLDATQIEGLNGQLIKVWPDLTKYKEPLVGNGLPLWSSQWSKHGTCSGLSQKGYFEMALKVMGKIDILKGLPTKYVPDNKYNPATMASQIKAKYRAATIICNIGTVEQFLEVHFKVDRDGNLQAISKPSVSCSKNTPVLLPVPPPQFDYYILAVQWPISFCNDKSDPKRCDRSSGALTLPAYFTIHGLWPQKNNGQVLEYCTKQPLDTTQISGLTDQLKKVWPNLKSYKEPLVANGLAHWSYEWSKHGTCSGLFPKDYFEMALKVMGKIDILKGLPTKYVPGNKYYPATMASEIKAKYGAATIICNTGTVEQFLELRFKVDLAGNLQAMPNPRVSCSKNTQVLLPK